MKRDSHPFVILLVEDEPAHAEIVRRNFETFHVPNRLMHVADGEAALDYLFGRGNYADRAVAPLPSLVLLDLRLPRLGGMDVLAEIKAHERLRTIPVVVMTTSAAERDVEEAYARHVNSYVVKPLDFERFTSLLQAVAAYWLVWNQNAA